MLSISMRHRMISLRGLGQLAASLGLVSACSGTPSPTATPEVTASSAQPANESGSASSPDGTASSDTPDPALATTGSGASNSDTEGVDSKLPVAKPVPTAGGNADGDTSDVPAPDATPPEATPPDATPPETTPPVVPPNPDLTLPPGVSSRFPSAGALGICRDVPLRLSFANDVRIGNAGKIRVFASNAPNTAVDTIDLAATAFSDTIAGRATNLVRPVFLDGRDVSVYFHRGALAPNTSYFVKIDAGAFVDGAGNALAAISDTSWTYSTGATPAPANPLVVDREGQGNFCTLQSALDAVPANNSAPITIELRNGNYHEIGYLNRKANVTLHGQDRDATVIAYPNNDKLNAGTAARAMLTALDSDAFVIDNLTLYNTTPQGGSQAEALRVRGDRSILRNANFKSLQDTLLVEGRVYVADSYVEGNVDFIWGVGAAYFERDEIKLVGRSGVIVQARNGANSSGYFFVDSRLTSDPGITGSTLARIDATVYPASQVAYINCQMGPHISAAGWTVTPTGTTATDALRFWEFGSTDLDGKVLDVSRRNPASRQLGPAEAASLRNRTEVLGGWDPTL
jgi:hypothetical protein